MKVGLFGGTFDPIHKAHLKLAAVARRQLELDRVYFVVSPRSPFKMGQTITPARVRFAMVRAALKGKAGFRAADWELRRGGPSYTVTTLRAYRRAHPSDDIFLILGTDALAGFPRWKEARTILKSARLAAGRRPGAAWPALPAAMADRVVRLRGTFPDISSTKIRARIRAGRAATVVPPAVARVIRRRGLYR